MSASQVAIARAGGECYPESPPFDPPEAYPETVALGGGADPSNIVYPAVRESFRLLGLDAERFGTPGWNPLGSVVSPGDRVVIKPNLVRHFHGSGLGTEALVTHGSVLRAVLDYVILALKGRGRITVGDSPLQYADFRKALGLAGSHRVVEDARRRTAIPIETVDFRKERSEKRRQVIVTRIPNEGDPRGYRRVELGEASRFRGLDSRAPRFRVTQYHPDIMRESHHGSRHAYLFPATVLEADVLLNLPKLKTHRKAGVTAAMKNLVGINGSKDWLPHHTFGSVAEGGDEYLAPSTRKRAISRLRDRMEATGGLSKRLLWAAERALVRTGRLIPFPDPFFEGSWYGNDTIWRTVHDLHRVLFFAGSDGTLRDAPQRKYLAVIDAIVAGEGDGPMRPTPRPAGLIVSSGSPLAADLACARIMGFDERRLPLIGYGLGNGFHPHLEAASEISLRTNDPRWERLLSLGRGETLAFAPPSGWAGHVELPD